jgi:hypothetical protein
MFERIPMPCPFEGKLNNFQYEIRSWIASFPEDPVRFLERMEKIYSYLAMMAEDDEYYLLAMKLEDQIQGSFLGEILDHRERDLSGIEVLLRDFDAANDPIAKIASKHSKKMEEDAARYRQNGAESAAIKLIFRYFKSYYTPLDKDSFGFSGRLDYQLNSGTFKQVRFFPFYFRNESCFSLSMAVIHKRIALNVFNRKREINAIKKALGNNQSFQQGFNDLVHRSITDLSWYSKRSFEVIHALHKGKWQLGELSNLGVPVNELMSKVIKDISSRKLSSALLSKFIEVYNSMKVDLSDEIRGKAIQALASIFCKTPAHMSSYEGSIELIDDILNSQTLSNAEKLGAYVNKLMKDPDYPAISLTEDDYKALPKIVSKLVKSADEQRRMFSRLGMDTYRHRLINKAKRNALAEDLGL